VSRASGKPDNGFSGLMQRASNLFVYIVSDLELSGKDTTSPELMAVLDLVANDA